jgi:uncharacterized protein (TIGR03437 family)
MRTPAWRVIRLAAASLLLSSASFGYYHFVHYLTRSAPYTPVYEKFDLNALTNRTVQFRISDQGPSQLAANDTMQAVYAQIRAAAKVWNSVETSDLRIAFAGIGSATAAESTPGIDVIFEEVPPGIVALAGPTLRGDVVAGSNGLFVPILRSVLQIRKDLSAHPSYGEAFFGTMVHEFGHTLGLQHTFTSSTMSTGTTRATTRSKPIGADDIAGLSILYPAAGFAASTGVISGRVTMGSDPVVLASVVAISPNGPAVSALTNPDGTYRIEGLTAGIQYLVYVHPVPPPLAAETTPGNLILPRDAGGNSISPSSAFDTVFFPGVKNPGQAFVFTVTAGQTLENVNFSVQHRSSVALYAVETYSFSGSVVLKPPTLNRTASRSYIVALGQGLSVNGAPAPGLGVSLISGSAVIPASSIKAYPYATNYVQFDVEFNPLSPEGYYHLVFSLANDIYVLPSAFQAVVRTAPAIAGSAGAVDSTGSRAVALTGANLGADTRFLFDGQPAQRVVEDAGRFVVTPPPGTAGQRASLVAVNTDGQSSLFLQSTPLFYTYETGDPTVVSLSPAALPAGVEALIEINALSGSFTDGQTVIGFGNSDLTVRKTWVVSPSRMLANVAVNAAAPVSILNFTIANGLQVVTQPMVFQVQPANPRQLTLGSQVVNAATGLAGVQAGSLAIVAVPALTQAQISAGLALTVNGVAAQIAGASPGQIVFQIPPSTPTGPAVLRVQAGGESSLAIAINIDLPAPAIVAALAGGVSIGASRPAAPAELVTLLVSNLADGVTTTRLQLTVAGIEHQIAFVSPAAAQGGLYQVSFNLNPAVPAGSHPVILTFDGRPSAAFALATRGL